MLKTLIVLPDDTELVSGTGTVNAIQSVAITECVNGSQELTLGSVCANMVEVKIIAPQGGVNVSAGDELTVYRVAEDGIRHKVGLFTAEKPTRPSANSLSITAYDRVTWLDRDLTQWLAGLAEFPYTLYDLAAMVCAECGLELLNEEIPNGSYFVHRFSADGITGRQLLQWVGQIAGRFCRATADGQIEFAWYTPATTHDIGVTPYGGNSVAISNGNLLIASKNLSVADDASGNVTVNSDLLTATDDGSGNVTIVLAADIKTIMYYQNGLSFEDYTVAAIQKVQLRQNEEDVGTVYPDGITEAVNTYSITGNPLLTAATGTELQPIAQTLYEQLKDVAYTPCKVSIPANMIIRAGNTVQITDRNGKTITAYVMTKTQKGQRDTLECTGSPKRDSTTATNNQKYEALSGKVLNLRTDVDGIRVENANNAGKLAEVSLDIEGIRGQVQTQKSGIDGIRQALTRVEQSAEDLKISVEDIRTNGAQKLKTAMGYTFDDTGLHIARQGQQMENLLDERGMRVTRSGQTILEANDEGVIATDVKVRNFLIVGDHARFEDYETGRTACFWLEEGV